MVAVHIYSCNAQLWSQCTFTVVTHSYSGSAHLQL